MTWTDSSGMPKVAASEVLSREAHWVELLIRRVSPSQRATVVRRPIGLLVLSTVK